MNYSDIWPCTQWAHAESGRPAGLAETRGHSQTTVSPTSQVLQNPLFLGQTGQRTLFMVESPHNGVNIQRYSAYSGEDEVRRAQGLRLRHLGERKQTPHLPLASWGHGSPNIHAHIAIVKRP